MRYDISANERTKGACNFHIANGGLCFSVEDRDDEYRKGPFIIVDGESHGTVTNHIEICTTSESLRVLGQMFLDAADAEYTEGKSHTVLGHLVDLDKCGRQRVAQAELANETPEEREERRRIIHERLLAEGIEGIEGPSRA